jgi:hypothetical protein
MMAYSGCRGKAPVVLNLDAGCLRKVTITPRQALKRGVGVLCKMKLQPDILIALDNKMIFLSHELKQVNPIAFFFALNSNMLFFFFVRQGF